MEQLTGRDVLYLSRQFSVVAFENDPDKVKIHVKGGPGYCSSYNHPIIRVVDTTDRHRVVVEKKGETKVEFDAIPRQRPRPLVAYTSPLAFLAYYFFPRNVERSYHVTINACGHRTKGERFGTFSFPVVAYPADTFKLSLTLPSAKKLSKVSEKGVYYKSAKDMNEHKVAGTYSNTTREMSGGLSRTKVTDTSRTETSRDGHQTTTGSTVTQDRTGSVTEDHNKSGEGPKDKDDAAKFRNGVSFKIEQNGSKNLTGEFDIVRYANTLLDMKKTIQTGLDLIKKMPQAGGKITCELEFLALSVSYEWGNKEANNQTIYPWWKLSVQGTIVSIKLEASVGFAVAGAEALLFLNITATFKVGVEVEAQPDKVEARIPNELGLTGAIGLRASDPFKFFELEAKATAGYKATFTVYPGQKNLYGLRLDREPTKLEGMLKCKLWFDKKFTHTIDNGAYADVRWGARD